MEIARAYTFPEGEGRILPTAFFRPCIQNSTDLNFPSALSFKIYNGA